MKRLDSRFFSMRLTSSFDRESSRRCKAVSLILPEKWTIRVILPIDRQLTASSHHHHNQCSTSWHERPPFYFLDRYAISIIFNFTNWNEWERPSPAHQPLILLIQDIGQTKLRQWGKSCLLVLPNYLSLSSRRATLDLWEFSTTKELHSSRWRQPHSQSEWDRKKFNRRWAQY